MRTFNINNVIKERLGEHWCYSCKRTMNYKNKYKTSRKTRGENEKQR